MSERRGEPPSEVREALNVVAEGRAYTREHFPVGNPDKYVGHHRADDFDAAIDVLVAWVIAVLVREEAP